MNKTPLADGFPHAWLAQPVWPGSPWAWQDLVQNVAETLAPDGTQRLEVSLTCTQFWARLAPAWQRQWEAALGLPVQFVWPEAKAPTASREPLPGVGRLLAVASGKGGVGKSTTAANLALALADLGYRVGMLDADIYGPSQAMMLGAANQKAEIGPSNRIKPCRGIRDISVISMAHLVADAAPLAWRGPMATGALQQLMRQTDWPNLDFLIVDMPPGTGDIQLTLAQTAPVTGSLIVTTPQDIALLDARRGIELFRKVAIPVLGIVENMAMHHCSQCGHAEAIFGTDGGDRLAAEYSLPVLGRLPLSKRIREEADAGTPTVAASPLSVEAQAYQQLAQQSLLALWFAEQQQAAAPVITQG